MSNVIELDDADMDESPHRRNWTTDEISSIISAVQKRPYLYDKRHPDYKQNAKKDTAWEQIAATLTNKHLTARECKRKWNTLRIQKRRIINQQGKKKGKHPVQWAFYDTLNFLMPHMEWPTYREGSTKKENSDNEYDETSCGENYENFHPTFNIKKIEDIEELNDDGTHDQSEDTEEDHLQQECLEEDMNSSSITVSQVNFIPVIAPQQQQQQQQQQQLQQSAHQQQHQQQTQQMQQQQQQQHELMDPLILPYHEIRQTPTSQNHTQQQLVSISRPVTITRFSAQPNESGHQNTVDSTATLINNLPSSNSGLTATTVDCTLTSSGMSHSGLMIPSSGSSSRLDYFLLDVQQQMEKLNDIAQMELKVDMQKLLLDKLRHIDNYKQNRCD